MIDIRECWNQARFAAGYEVAFGYTRLPYWLAVIDNFIYHIRWALLPPGQEPR